MRTSMRVMLVTVLLLAGTTLIVQAEDQISGIYRGLQPVVRFDISPPLRDIPPNLDPVVWPGDDPDLPPFELGPQDVDPIVQDWTGGPEMIPAPLISFQGQANAGGYTPPDPVGDVGPNHYVAMANVRFQIFDKAGTSLYGPANNNTLWSGFGGACQNENMGDPIVLYDQIADRWMLTQFTANGPTYYNCVAVSTTGDPTGTWYRWAISTGSNFPDYPKYGIWTDAYYIATREFAGGSNYTGVGVYALERADIIAGNPTPHGHLLLPAPLAPVRRRRRPAPGRPRRLCPAAGRQPRVPRRLAGPGRPVRRTPGRPQPVEVLRRLRHPGELDADPDQHHSDHDLRHHVPVRQLARLHPAAGGIAEDRHPVLPAAAAPPPRLPQLRHPRVDGHQPVGGGIGEHGRHPLVGDPRPERHARHLPGRDLRPRRLRRHPPLDGLDRPGLRRQHGPWLQRVGRHRHLPELLVHRPACRRPARHHAPGRG